MVDGGIKSETHLTFVGYLEISIYLLWWIIFCRLDFNETQTWIYLHWSMIEIWGHLKSRLSLWWEMWFLIHGIWWFYWGEWKVLFFWFWLFCFLIYGGIKIYDSLFFNHSKNRFQKIENWFSPWWPASMTFVKLRQLWTMNHNPTLLWVLHHEPCIVSTHSWHHLYHPKTHLKRVQVVTYRRKMIF